MPFLYPHDEVPFHFLSPNDQEIAKVEGDKPFCITGASLGHLGDHIWWSTNTEIGLL